MPPSEPGLYRDLPFADYAAIPAINSGVVKAGTVSMKHMKAALDGAGSDKDTKDRKLGRAIHCRLLEPERYRAEYLVATPCKAVKQDGQECGNSAKLLWDDVWYCGVRGHAPKDAREPADYISEGDSQRIEAVAAALHDHPVMRLFRREGWSEVSCVWESHGLLRKCRIDRYAPGDKPLIIDIKKCQVGAGRKEDCEKAIHGNGYYRQLAGNVEAIEALTGKTPDAIWVFVDDDYPFDVNIIPADAQTVAIGRWENNDIIGRFAASQNRNDYRGYIYDSRFIRHGGLPLWYREQCMRLGIGTGDDSSGSSQPEYADFDEPEQRAVLFANSVADGAAVD